jgi:hypothetical protein
MDLFKHVGMMIGDDADRLEALGFGKDAVESKGMFDSDMLPVLREFCKSHPNFHIVTLVEDDDGEATIYVNRAAFANRLGYYLADGDKNDTLWEEAD